MRPPKTLDEIKSTLLARAGRGNPVRGLSREEVEAVVARLQSVDPDHWAKVWSDPAEPWLAKAKEAEKSGGNEGARESYLKAYAYFAAARYPALFSPEMEQAYVRARDAYQKASRYFDPPLEVVRIPFEKKEIVGYLRLRSGEGKQPLVFHWGGIDGWKEERQGNTEALIQAGFGSFCIDGPGTGECPILASPTAERVFSAAIDYLVQHPKVDSERIAVVGSSFGGYWATKVAHVEAARLRGAVNWGGGVHFFLQPSWLRESQFASSYLFNLSETRARILGLKTVDEFITAAASMSLLDQGWLNRPSAPMLLVNGKKDEQVPINDLYLLLEHGAPKEARIFPDAGHMGKSPDALHVVIAWLKKRLGGSGGQDLP